MAVNYASVLGIRSFIAPIVFAGLYSVLFAYFFIRAVARSGCIYLIIAFFCAVRIAAFVLRALLAKLPSDAENLYLFITYDALYDAGFFAMLYSANRLIAARMALAKHVEGPIASLLRIPFLFFFALFAAVGLSITGAVMGGLGVTENIVNTGNALRKVAVYVFFGCSVVVFLRTWFLPPVRLSVISDRGWACLIGQTCGAYILLVMSVLVLVREVFFTATIHNTSTRNNEAFWYPFSVVTEFIAIFLCATPGLIPASANDNWPKLVRFAQNPRQ